jgi:branched-chain amino acid transport system permease protein
MNNFIQTIINGLLTSGVYLIVTIGLTLVLGIMRIVNFAHGELVMIGAYITYWCFTLLKMNPYVSLILNIIVLFIIGIIIYKIGISKILDAPSLDQVLLTFGFSILFQNLALILWTANAYGISLKTEIIKIGNIQVGRDRVIVFIIGFVITIILSLILSKTKFGKTLNAISQNRNAAYLVGINVPYYYMLSFGIASALAGLAGGLVGIVMYTSPYIGAKLGLRAFAILVLAGLGNINMAIIASIILGLLESFISVYVPQGPGWAEGLSFFLILIILTIKPSGIKGLRSE